MPPTPKAKDDEPGAEVAVPDEAKSPQTLSDAQEARMKELAAEAREAIDIQEDVRLPALSLVQKTSKTIGEERPGEIVHTLTTESFKGVEVLLVKMNKTRTYWPKLEGLSNPPACTSPNALDGWGDPGEEEMKRDS